MKGKPVVEPICLAATYEFECTDDLVDVVRTGEGYIYSRWDNPTVRAAEAAVAALEKYESAQAFSSGMAAITTAIMALISKGDRVISMSETYGGTFAFVNHVLPRLGIETVSVTLDEPDRLPAEIERGGRLLYLESPTNPLLRVVDIARLSAAAHAEGMVVLLDSTFASPVNQSPKALDVDVTLHSATKYLGGHHDLMAGFACCDGDLAARIWEHRKIFGGVLDAHVAYLVLRGLKTLRLRVEKQNENAMALARFLEAHPKVAATNYPGLESHPDHEIAKRQMSGFGGMLSFDIDTDFQGAKRFMDSLRLIKLATSLGGVSSLATQPATNTHVGLSPEERQKVGISDSLIRLSVGIEDVSVLQADMEQALAKA